MRERFLAVARGLSVSLVWLALWALPVAAQSDDSDDAPETYWRVIAAVLLAAFIAAVVFLMATRWRRLIPWQHDGD
jgi:membrane protein YdbS with pleckstrin-like domain